MEQIKLKIEQLEGEKIMARKTAGVKLLVQDVLTTMDKPYSEDITLEVFQTIEQDRDWRRRYDALCEDLSQWVVNNWIGQYTKELAGFNHSRQVVTNACQLIGSYSKLW